MRRLWYIVPALLLALVALWALWPGTGRLDDMGTDAHQALFRLPRVTQVTRVGPTRPIRRVVHVLDYHMLPDDLARADGHDVDELARKVDRVQKEQAELFIHLHRLGVQSVHLEGLVENELPLWKLRMEHAVEQAEGITELRQGLAEVKPGPGAETARAQIDAMEQDHRKEVRHLGVLALLARRGIRVEALPLDDEKVQEKADPKLEKGEVVVDHEAWKARREAMVELLPERGLVVVVLGVAHDLGPLLGKDTEYLRVEVAAVREAIGR